ncbi:MAG: nucleoside hydrolase [Ruminococcaceae bacterium]|nr:nucleoside hydrolase [Oscillospiraceae bacterium]
MFNVTESLKAKKRKKIILDTDTFNEIDDQFALSLALLSPEEIELLAVTAAPFNNDKSDYNFGKGMERSYEEIGRVMNFVCESHPGVKPVPYYRGSTTQMPDENTPVMSEAVEVIHKIAMEQGTPEDRVYVVAIGAITNVASALVAYPEIADRIAVVWLGSHARWFGGPEFNLFGDRIACNAMYASKAPVLTVPCMGVASELITTLPELEYHLKGKSPLGDYLCKIVAACEPGNHPKSWSRVIWDISAVCAVIDPECYRSIELDRPRVEENWSYNYGYYEGKHEHIETLNRDRIFSLLFSRLL